MKKINLNIILVSIALLLLVKYNWDISNEVLVFHGFANNKELHVNLEHAASVTSIYVQPGQKVQKGDPLIEVSRSNIKITQSDINHDILNLQSQFQIWESGLKSSIRTLKHQKTERKNELQSAINKLASEISINASLIKDINSIDKVTDKDGNDPRQIELNGLKADLNLSMKTFNSQIRKLNRELSNPENPLLIQIEKLNENLNFVNEEEESQSIYAAKDGIVGTILCKVGEFLPSFATYLTIYEESPNHVKGYVSESLILEVNINDTLIIQSVSHTNEIIEGVVIGMGSRIVEIPPRLRKNPAFVIYGREIEISIPSPNTFLQNEKVILKNIVNQKNPINAAGNKYSHIN